MAELNKFDATGDNQGAIDQNIARTLETVKDADTRRRLEWARQVYLEWDGQHKKALANVRRLLRQSDLPEEYRKHLAEREVYNLMKVGRIDEGLALCDRLIAEEKDPTKRIRLLRDKASWCSDYRPQLSIAAYKVYREAAKPGTEDWSTATVLMGR